TKLFPSSFEPLYDRVSFGTRPYVEALATAHRHDRGFRVAAWVAAALALAVAIAGAAWAVGIVRHDREASAAEAARQASPSAALAAREATR
ncbi:MAG: hypothetical protein ACO38W_02840, partial [Phycisphaerales bacterium]